MKRIGFVISHKENEFRRALVPADIPSIKNRDRIFVEQGYGEKLGFSDEVFLRAGVNVCSRQEALSMEIVCDPKIGDADYLAQLSDQTVFGWIHAVQNRPITDAIIAGRLTAYAWEDMHHRGLHTFYRNNEIAGEAAIMHAFQCHGEFPYQKRVAVIGRGNTAMGAIKALHYLGANVTVYNRATEGLFRAEIGQYDTIVNAVLWDTRRTDHIICREDLHRMRPGSMIIDISCDRAGGIETSVPTTIEQPDYMVDGVRHYVVDHTPSLFYKTASAEISRAAAPFYDALIEDRANADEVLAHALAIEGGRIVDQRIIDFQKRTDQ